MKPEVNINTIHSALSKIEDVSLRTVMRRASRENWFCREAKGTGRGGKTRLSLTPLLPADVRAALKSVSVPAVIENRLPAYEAHKEQRLCEAQEQKAFAKAELANAYVTRMESAGHGQKKRLKRLFFENYNLGEQGLLPAVYKHVGRVDMRGRTVHGWITKLKKNNWDPMCLADRRGYSGKGKRAVTPEQMKIILSIVQSPYNVPGKPIAEIIRQAKDIMTNRGIDTLSDTTYRRWLEKDWIPYNYDQWIFWREGDKGLNDKVLFNLIRDYDKVECGDLLVADGHVLNFEIINPDTGKPKRMMLILFYDFKSSYPLGWEIMATENTESISMALRRAILRLGKIPTAVYIDNGRAFKGKYFINRNPGEELTGLYQRLGIRNIIAWAYHGQSKPVERFFRTFAELERLAPSYVGTSIDNKPVHLNRGEKLRRQLHLKITYGVTPTIEDAHRAIAMWFDKYANTPQSASSHLAGQTPAEVMVPGPGVDPVMLRCLMMKSEQRLIRQNGVNLHGKGSWYYSPELYGRRHAVYCRYDLVNKDSILVYDVKDDSFICEAFKVGKVHPMASILGTEADKAELERQIAMKMRGRKQTVATAREIAETQVLPESRQRIESAGFRIEGNQIKQPKALPAPEDNTPIDEEKIKRDLEELETIREDDPVEPVSSYEPEVMNEAEQVFSRLKELSEYDRFEKLIELEVKGWLIPREQQAFMKYFEQSTEYERHREYFEDYRVKMAVVYDVENTGTEN
ncbi:Mu transposase C-terminal domain-containing protein [Desulfobacula phenolica]|uniref:Putative transposase n=1 Tax=Desulfobacula phenolica TaxID=90732 RepID=A0A1H2H5Z5_9BACT|nr:Mu transposase C-terminal domain-containing protein [Desulfobacula phenolica]SDU27291.1 putative transposase [Desulfobacula phenolica]